MQAALEQATSFQSAGAAGVEVIDARASVETIVLARDDLRRIKRGARQLTSDQRLVLSSQLTGVTCEVFCARFGWSREKYRKVAQRGRARLRQLIDSYEPRVSGVPSGGWRSD
jgi:DNA-directed RNA polymerase specialized sigma24 family protein